MSELIRKQFLTTREDLGERRLQFVITTSAKDRDNDTINPQGWGFDNYLKNPVVLFAHDYTKPAVAKTIDLRVEGDKVVAVAEFPTPEIYDFGYTLYLLYREGFMNAVSVGFIPLEFKQRDDGYDYIKQELLEYSLVPVPANPEALVVARSKGINLKPLYKSILEIMEKDEKILGKEEFEQIEMAMKEKETKSIVVSKGVIPYKETPLADPDEPWDGPAEVREADVEDLKIMCTWYDSEKPDIKSSYKLPHHNHKAKGQHACVWRGVAAAMAALLGARGGVKIPDEDRKGVYNHLAKHYKDFDKEPPEFKEYTEEELKQLFPEVYAENLKAGDEVYEEVSETVDNTVEEPVGETEKAEEQAVEKVEVVEKVGRMLSKANKERIRKAVQLLEEVLAQLDEQQEEEEGQKEEKEEISEDEIRSIIKQTIQKEINKVLGKIE